MSTLTWLLRSTFDVLCSPRTSNLMLSAHNMMLRSARNHAHGMPRRLREHTHAVPCSQETMHTSSAST